MTAPLRKPTRKFRNTCEGLGVKEVYAHLLAPHPSCTQLHGIDPFRARDCTRAPVAGLGKNPAAAPAATTTTHGGGDRRSALRLAATTSSAPPWSLTRASAYDKIYLRIFGGAHDHPMFIYFGICHPNITKADLIFVVFDMSPQTEESLWIMIATCMIQILSVVGKEF